MSSRADLHLHSRCSDRPSEWFLRRIGAPESFSEPRWLYETCRAKGMSFVTISDHNCIDGVLEIAHLPGVFLSTEVTTYFPEDGCKVHCLVSGIDETEFREIQEVRPDIFELRDYVLEHDIVCTVAHPLFSVNDRLTVEHFEKLLVLFKRFEIVNGARDTRAGTILLAILQNLTPAMMSQLANRHDIDPRDDEPWRKWQTAGSDDHGGLYVASAWTETPPAADVEAFIARLRAGQHGPAGSPGSSLMLARSFYSIAYRYYRERLLGDERGQRDVFTEIFARLLEDEELDRPMGKAEKIAHLAGQFVRPRSKTMGRIDRAVVDELMELATLVDDRELVTAERRCFEVASRLSHQLSFASLKQAGKHLLKGRLTESLQTLSSLGPIAVCIAPYLAAFQTQHKDERMMQQVAAKFPASRLLQQRHGGRAWLTDTFGEVNGVSVTIESGATLAARQGRELVIVTSQVDVPETDLALRNFPPVGEVALPEYEQQRVAFPPFLEVIEYCERMAFSELIISTPGPLGVAGIAAGRLLGIRLTGIYHTDFPLYVKHLTESPTLEELTAKYMRWFYGQMDRVYVPSRSYLEKLAEQGLDAERLRLLPKGVDLDRFGPARRDPHFWRRFGLGDRFKFLYVGRISKEKNLEALLSSFVAFREYGYEADLVLVGDGPHLNELASRYRRPEILFTGFLNGDDLPRAYASADLFVFPSKTDTFGNAVLEAQASGLPAVVSDVGGAQELVVRSRSGVVLDVDRPGELTYTMTKLFLDTRRRERMRESAILNAGTRSWDALMEELWPTEEPEASFPYVGARA
jgi:glycosyltransferase involved in cell wall biosynthesis